MPESLDARNASSDLCSWSDADEVLASGKSPTVPEVLGSLTAKVERDVLELDPPISKGFPMIKRSLKI